MNRLKDLLGTVGLWLLGILLIWLVVAQITFKLRHPWTTRTERFLHIFQAMKFEQVSYEKMRMGK
jgi:hypothetical protein